MQKIRIEIPLYIRTVQTSKKQNPTYYEWTGTTIKGKKKHLLLEFIKPEFKHSDIILPEYLKPDFTVACFKDKKVIAVCDTLGQIMLHQQLNRGTVHTYKYLVISRISKEKVIANINQVGKPAFKIISGQDIFSGKLREHLRGFIFQAIKNSYVPYVKDIPIITDYPVRIKMYIYDTVKNFNDNTNKNETGTRWDLGNRAYPYGKAMLDLLVTGTNGTDKVMESKLIDDDRLHVTEDPQGGVFCPLEDNDDSKRKLVFIIETDKRKIIKRNKFYNGVYAESLIPLVDIKVKKVKNPKQTKIQFISELGIKMSNGSLKFDKISNGLDIEFKMTKGESTETEDNLL